MEQYIDLLLRLGVDHVRFGASLKVGRNKQRKLTEWDVSDEDCVMFSKKLELLRSKYPTISFADFEEDNDFTFDSTKEQYSFRCNAGKKLVVFSEKEKVRPCLYTPAKFFEILTIDEYFSLVECGKNYNYTNCIDCCLKDLRTRRKELDTICPYGFE